MPKRSCPFGESAPVQLKTRVRLRELSQGVMGERYQREIFEKTKELLFRGAQAYMDNSCSTCSENTAGTCLNAEYPEPLASKPGGCSQHRCNGQMLIGQDGKLRQPCASETALPVGVSVACSSCVRTMDIKEACTQCDRYICQNCSQLCCSCNAVVCSLCSVTETDDFGERILCNGCLMFKDSNA
ncbi:Apoptosis regulatory protein Siva [Varanus komodoensis]|uniref:SIVA1 apoptosis inducing factor n=1 Tax=Varanus komodoensis TaxID=61221 RepID=A0A8D2IJ29_VARKO|nr:apoptosis regulatory protein Siva [Varanus komodoensis]KAF7251504.1 Apoptosis regulatory protein Siva [Varanus komodoensis]